MVDIGDILFKHIISNAKNGYKNYAYQAMRWLSSALEKDRELSASEKQYLRDCLRRSAELEDANKGFHINLGRGKNKTDTVLRDYRAAEIMTLSEGSNLKYDDRLSKAVAEINKDFPEAPAGKKTVEKAYEDYKEAVLINRAE